LDVTERIRQLWKEGIPVEEMAKAFYEKGCKYFVAPADEV
jgi:hypothetical protein